MSLSLIGWIGAVMSRDRVDFGVFPDNDSSPSAISGLVLDLTPFLGLGARLDFSLQRKHRLLAADLLTALGIYWRGNINSVHGINVYKTAISAFLRYAAHGKYYSRIRLADLTEEMMVGFKSHLSLSQTQRKNSSRRKIYGNIVRLIGAAQRIGLIEQEFVAPKNLRHQQDSDITQPYTHPEALDLEAICRGLIDDLHQRLQRGRELLIIGKNPRGRYKHIFPIAADKPWNRLENMIWYVVNVFDGAPLSVLELRARKEWTFLNAIRGLYGGAYKRKDIYTHLYPIDFDLIPYFILIALYTGRNESSLLTLDRDCLEIKEGRTYFLYRKERSGDRVFRRVVKDDGAFSVATLIRDVLKITEPLIQFAPKDHRRFLFLGLTLQPKSDVPVRAVDPCYFKAQMNGEGGWVDKIGIKDEKGGKMRISLRRIRVTYLSRRYLRHGQLSKVSQDAAHALADTTVNYINNESTKHVHNHAIREGQKSALSVASPPKVLSTNNIKHAAKSLGIDEAKAKRYLSGEMDVLFAACSDMFNRPDGPENTRCDKPWACFGCGNTIITRHVLPRVIAFRNHAEKMRREIPENEWNEIFRTAISVVKNDVLPKFSSVAIKQAENYAARSSFFIPIALAKKSV